MVEQESQEPFAMSKPTGAPSVLTAADSVTVPDSTAATQTADTGVTGCQTSAESLQIQQLQESASNLEKVAANFQAQVSALSWHNDGLSQKVGGIRSKMSSLTSEPAELRSTRSTELAESGSTGSVHAPTNADQPAVLNEEDRAQEIRKNENNPGLAEYVCYRCPWPYSKPFIRENRRQEFLRHVREQHEDVNAYLCVNNSACKQKPSIETHVSWIRLENFKRHIRICKEYKNWAEEQSSKYLGDNDLNHQGYEVIEPGRILIIRSGKKEPAGQAESQDQPSIPHDPVGNLSEEETHEGKSNGSKDDGDTVMSDASC